MAEPRELRGAVPFEIAAVIAIAAVPWPDQLPLALPLVLAATLSRWIRRRSWAEVVRGGGFHALVGAGAGFAALVAAVFVASPMIEAIGMYSVEWSEHPVVRGNWALLATVMVHAAIAALATELALRGWIVERVLELTPGPPVLPVIVGALAEAAITPGDVGARFGASVFGVGLGWLYIAGGRSVVAPACARMAFAMLGVLLEGFRVIG